MSPDAAPHSTLSTPSQELLLRRQLRAAEIALETARRRRAETEVALDELRAEIRGADIARAEAMAARQRDGEAYRAAVAASQRLELAAERRYRAEHERRVGLEQELTAQRQAAERLQAAHQELAAETRVRRLEAELELVIRRAAEFEYGVRMAAFDAFKLVRNMSDLVGTMLGRTPLGELPKLLAAPRDVAGPNPAQDGVQASPAAPDPAPWPPPGSVLDSDRLDAALERLRANAEPPEEDG